MTPIPDTDPLPVSASMREADRRTIEDLGIPGVVLMETAGRAVAEVVWKQVSARVQPRIVVACGGGNNGGDGFVVARVLHAHGAEIVVLLAADPKRLPADAALHYQVLRSLAGQSDRLTITDDPSPTALAALRAPDLLVDALLGTGQSTAPRDPIAGVVRWMNHVGRPVVSVDIPTGIDANTGLELGEAVRATTTVTMAARKIGLVLADGPGAAGEVVVAEIGIPDHVLRDVIDRTGGAFLTTDRAVSALLATVPRRGHKYTSGPAFVAGGSSKYTGAPVLASKAAARAGAGYVVCCTPDVAAAVVGAAMPDVPCTALPSDEDGLCDGERAARVLSASASRARALLVGPGLGRGPTVSAFVRKVLSDWTGPAVVDADGLNALDAAFVRDHGGDRWILTPHAAEFGRLAGGEVESIVPDAVRAAKDWGVTVLLKGYPSVVADPDGTAYVCATGNSALATAGTGDVLAGLCVGLLARGLKPTEAAVCAVHLGGAAADRYSRRCGVSTMTATDLLAEIGPVVRERFE